MNYAHYWVRFHVKKYLHPTYELFLPDAPIKSKAVLGGVCEESLRVYYS
ncbi:MAG: hypothetical protein QOE47_2166 [Pyrinomonadaceae bacterium]|nr:hypothetical protein [Pyrinomonadaceae bacterium]